MKPQAQVSTHRSGAAVQCSWNLEELLASDPKCNAYGARASQMKAWNKLLEPHEHTALLSEKANTRQVIKKRKRNKNRDFCNLRHVIMQIGWDQNALTSSSRLFTCSMWFWRKKLRFYHKVCQTPNQTPRNPLKRGLFTTTSLPSTGRQTA
jgi:hypothetical protein